MSSFLSKVPILTAAAVRDDTHSFMTQKPLFRCDINWKRKKFSLSLTHSPALCLMASLESSYQHRNFFLLFLPSFKHTFSSYFFSSPLNIFFLIIIFLLCYWKVFPFYVRMKKKKKNFVIERGAYRNDGLSFLFGNDI